MIVGESDCIDFEVAELGESLIVGQHQLLKVSQSLAFESPYFRIHNELLVFVSRCLLIGLSVKLFLENLQRDCRFEGVDDF